MWHDLNQPRKSCQIIKWILLFFLITTPVTVAKAQENELVRHSLNLPQAEHPPTHTTTSTSPTAAIKVTIKKNMTLSHALEEAQVAQVKQTAYKISQAQNSKFITSLRVGDTLEITKQADGKLVSIFYQKNPVTSYLITNEDKLLIKEQTQPIETKITMVSAKIDDSFYLAGERAGLSPRTIMNLADLLAWDVDFIRELRQGNQFKVIYEKQYIQGKYIGDGAILAAEFIVGDNKRTIKAYRLEEDGKLIGYYTEDGKNLRKAFMRNPINYTRISSTFQVNRLHPITNKIRNHRGVDYAAPTGTPIYASGDGTLEFRGWKGGYGNVVFIKHAGKYTTVYGHMSRFGKFRQGQSVKQGDVIGYVGMTGLATGPHLHYEFRINGVHVDPLKVKFPDSAPVKKEHLANFNSYKNFMSAQLERINPEITQLALKFE